MGGIALSAGIRQNLLSLQSTADMMSQTSNRLSTGMKVNSALDNPQSFFTAQGLSNRASDLSTLQDSMGLATQTLQAADKGITAIQKLVDQAKSTANQALQATATSTTLTGAASSDIASTDLLSGLGVTSGKTVTVSAGSASYTFTASGGSTVADLIAGINGDSGLTTEGLSVSLSNGQLSFTDTSGGDVKLTTDGAITNLVGSSTSSTNGTTLTEARATFASDYDNLRTQIDQLATDASFNGVNLLNGDNLTVKFNEDGSSKLDITGVTYDSSGLSINAADFSSDSKVEAAVAELNTATNTLRAQSSTFGGNLSVVQNREDFTKNMINVLQTGADGLTLADTNEEGANMLALQTRQSLSTTALSMASRADQAVLSFLR